MNPISLDKRFSILRNFRTASNRTNIQTKEKTKKKTRFFLTFEKRFYKKFTYC